MVVLVISIRESLKQGVKMWRVAAIAPAKKVCISNEDDLEHHLFSD